LRIKGYYKSNPLSPLYAQRFLGLTPSPHVSGERVGVRGFYNSKPALPQGLS